MLLVPGVILLLLLIVWGSGCIWLAVPELAYQGYKYEHQPKDNNSSSQAPRDASADHSIE